MSYKDDGIQGSIYDVATQKLGNAWRLPTVAEIQELISRSNFYGWASDGAVYFEKNGQRITIPFDPAEQIIYIWTAELSASEPTRAMVLSISAEEVVDWLETGSEPYTFDCAIVDAWRCEAGYVLPVSDTQGLVMGLSVEWAETPIVGKYAFAEVVEKDEFLWENYLCTREQCGTNSDPLFMSEPTRQYLDYEGLKLYDRKIKEYVSGHGGGMTPAQVQDLANVKRDMYDEGGKVATLEQKTSKFTPTLESGVKIGEVEDINGNKQNVYAPRGSEGGGATTIAELEDGYRVSRLEEDNYTPRVVNLFNKEEAVENELVNWSTGVFSFSEGRLRSDYIPVREGQYIMCWGGRYTSGSAIVSGYCWYDGNRRKTQSGKNGFTQGELIVVPQNVEYIVFTNIVECKNTLMLLVSDRQFEIPKDYIPFNEVAGDESRINIIGHTIDSIYEGVKKVSDNIYEPIVTSVFDKETAVDGYAINYVYGTLSEKRTHFVSDYIPVKEGQYITMWGGLGTYNNSNYCWFNIAKSAITGATSWEQGNIIIVPSNVSYLRFVSPLNYKESVMILVSDRDFKLPTDYVPYNTSIGGESRIVNVGSLEDLQTADKTSIVGAINELYALIGQLAKS